MEPVTVQLALGYAAGHAIHLAHPGAAGTVAVSCARLTSWPTFLQMCCAQVGDGVWVWCPGPLAPAPDGYT